MKTRTAGCFVLFASLILAACSSEGEDPNYWGQSGTAGASGTAGSAGSSGAATGGSGGEATGGTGGGATGGTGGEATGGTGGEATGGTGGEATGGTGGEATGGTGGGATGGTGGTSTDPDAAARAACVAKINELRATKGLSPYGQWTSAEACVDDQVTQDQATSSPHGSFGQCGESGQNECLGGGIEGCLESMWAEKDQPGCAGCDACADGYNPNCPNCDFYGTTTGDVCGHYVNMSAKYFSQVACGFSDQGWAAQDYH